jgi:hypothetical protein
MKPSKRAAWLLLFLGVGLSAGILFRGFILENMVTPMALLLWIFWREVQSVHQATYWGALILLAVGLAVYRLVKSVRISEAATPPTPRNILREIGYWRLAIQLSGDQDPAILSVKGNLVRMLAAMYAAEQPEATPQSIEDALRLRQKPLPDPLYAFLFPDGARGTKRPWRQRLKSLAAAPKKWIRRWTGREQAEYYHAINETLTFMEALMEIKHGDDDFDPSNH